MRANHLADWQWLIHGDRKITANVRGQRLRTRTRTANSQVNLYGSQTSNIDVSTVFDPPAHNWGGNKTFLGKNMTFFPDQWHVSVAPKNASKVMRFLTIFQVCDRQNDSGFQELAHDEDGIHIDSWCIRATLDPDQSAGLEIRHDHKPLGLAADIPSFALAKKSYRAANASLLVESHNVQRTRDVLPQAAR